MKTPSNPAVTAAHKAVLQPPDDVPKGIMEWLEKNETGQDMDAKA